MQSKIKYDTTVLKTISYTLDEFLHQSNVGFRFIGELQHPMQINRIFRSNLITHCL